MQEIQIGHLDKTHYHKGGQTLEKIAHLGCGISVLESVQTSWPGLEHPKPSDLVQARVGLDLNDFTISRILQFPISRTLFQTSCVGSTRHQPLLCRRKDHSKPDVIAPQWVLAHFSTHSTQLKISVYNHAWRSKEPQTHLNQQDVAAVQDFPFSSSVQAEHVEQKEWIGLS